MRKKKCKIYAVVMSLLLCLCGINDIYANEQMEMSSITFNLENMKVGDVVREYQGIDEYVQIELLSYEPLNSSRAIEDETTWSGSIPDGTYTLRPSKVYGAYNYSFKMTIIVDGLSTTIARVYSPVTDCPLALTQTRTLSIITERSTENLEALAEMSWEQTNSVDGTSVGTFSSYLGCMIRYRVNDYKVYWRI